MIGLFVLILSLVGIVRMARTRGASPWLYGLLAGVGWFVADIVMAAVLWAFGFVSPSGRLTVNTALVVSVSPWAWLGLVALFVRYKVGKGVEGPSGNWICPNCHLFNQSYALKCDSCGQAYSSARAAE